MTYEEALESHLADEQSFFTNGFYNLVFTEANNPRTFIDYTNEEIDIDPRDYEWE